MKTMAERNPHWNSKMISYIVSRKPEKVAARIEQELQAHLEISASVPYTVEKGEGKTLFLLHFEIGLANSVEENL